MIGTQRGINEFIYVLFCLPKRKSLRQRFEGKKFSWKVIPRGLSR